MYRSNHEPVRRVQSDKGRGSLPARRGTRGRNQKKARGGGGRGAGGGARVGGEELGLGRVAGASGHPGALQGQVLGSQTQVTEV